MSDWFHASSRSSGPDRVSHNSSAAHQRRTARSSRSSTSSTSRFTESQTIPGSWVDERKLKTLLNRRFGSDYELRVSESVVVCHSIGAQALACG